MVIYAIRVAFTFRKMWLRKFAPVWIRYWFWLRPLYVTKNINRIHNYTIHCIQLYLMSANTDSNNQMKIGTCKMVFIALSNDEIKYYVYQRSGGELLNKICYAVSAYNDLETRRVGCIKARLQRHIVRNFHSSIFFLATMDALCVHSLIIKTKENEDKQLASCSLPRPRPPAASHIHQQIIIP